MGYRRTQGEDQVVGITGPQSGSFVDVLSGSDGINRLRVDSKLDDATISNLTASIGNIGYKVRYDKWPNVTNNLDNTYEDVYVATTGSNGYPIAFLDAIFQLNSDNIDMRVYVDGDLCGEFDFEELKDDFKLSSNGDSSSGGGGAGPRFGIVEYSSNRWHFQPLIPITAKAEFKIQMRSQSGTKKLYRGLSTIRTRTC